MFPSGARNLLPLGKRIGTKHTVMARSHQMPSEPEQVAYGAMHSDKSLRQKVFNVTKAEAKPMVNPDCVTDDFRRESMTVVQ